MLTSRTDRGLLDIAHFIEFIYPFFVLIRIIILLRSSRDDNK